MRARTLACFVLTVVVGVVGSLAGGCSGQPDPLGIDQRRGDAPPPAASSALPPVKEADASTGPDPDPIPIAPADDASTPPDAAPVETSLADLILDVVSNGHGPLEKNTSNGEANAGDGLPITLDGVVYPKGLGVHAPSEVKVSLGGAYKTFLADVGIDDEVKTGGSVVFKIVLDGVEVYDSGVLTSASATKKVSLDVTGKQQMQLIVTIGGDDNSYDHADWAGARLVK